MIATYNAVIVTFELSERPMVTVARLFAMSDLLQRAGNEVRTFSDILVDLFEF